MKLRRLAVSSRPRTKPTRRMALTASRLSGRCEATMRAGSRRISPSCRTYCASHEIKKRGRPPRRPRGRLSKRPISPLQAHMGPPKSICARPFISATNSGPSCFCN
jgi:hypothetical protein